MGNDRVNDDKEYLIMLSKQLIENIDTKTDMLEMTGNLAETVSKRLKEIAERM
jgi:hypothetical protein